MSMHFLCRYTLAGVLHADAYAARSLDGTTHVNVATCVVVFDRIGQKIDQNLLDPHSVSVHIAGSFKPGKRHGDVALFCQRRHHVLALTHHAVQSQHLGRHRQRARFNGGQIQRIVDQPQQVPAGFDNMRQTLLLLGSRRWRTSFYQLGKT